MPRIPNYLCFLVKCTLYSITIILKQKLHIFVSKFVLVLNVYVIAFKIKLFSVIIQIRFSKFE